MLFLHMIDVLDMVDVLVEDSDGLDEEIGFTLNEDTIIQTFPFSAVVPAALEARNKLLLQAETETGTNFFVYLYHSWEWRVEVGLFLPSELHKTFYYYHCQQKGVHFHGFPCSGEAYEMGPSLLTLGKLFLGSWSRKRSGNVGTLQTTIKM